MTENDDRDAAGPAAPRAIELDVNEAVGELGDAATALEALRLVGATIQRMDKANADAGGGPAMPEQIDALLYLVGTVRGHVVTAQTAAERAEQALAN